MCFDGCSPSLSSAHFEKPRTQPIIYPLGRSHVSEMFSHKSTYCAPVSQLFMLQLCHSSMSLHPFQQKGKNEGRERQTEDERLGETGLSSDILSGRPGYCVLGETTPVIAITLAGRAACTRTYTGPKQPQVSAHAHTIVFVSIQCQHRKIAFG